MFTKINTNKNNYLHYTDRCRQTATDTITEFCRISVLPLLGSVGIGQSLFSPTEYTALTFAGSWNVLEVTLLVGLVQWIGLKGIVHPKNSPSSSSKPVWMSLFCWTQKIFWRIWETEQFCGTIDFHSIFFFFSCHGSQCCPKTVWLQTFFKISSFVFSRTKTFIQVWNYLRVSKLWHNFHLWLNHPFNW